MSPDPREGRLRRIRHAIAEAFSVGCLLVSITIGAVFIAMGVGVLVGCAAIGYRLVIGP